MAGWRTGDEDTQIIADVMVESDLRGIDSHGISMLPLYSAMRRDGQLNTKAKSRTVRKTCA